jgi:4a-hydroxytetrahydrobiopterin dehydratase
MSDLVSMHCVRVSKDDSTVSDGEVKDYKSQIPDWKILEQDGSRRIQRTYTFEDFEEALEFTNEVGELAEEEDHHPVITTEWGKVTVTFWTHVIGGLHRNDFIMAAKTDEAYGS